MIHTQTKPLEQSKFRCVASRSGYLAIALVGLTFLVGGCHSESKEVSSDQPTMADPIPLMEAAIQAGDWHLADRYCKQALIAKPNDPDLLTKVATVTAYCDRKREAATLLVDAARIANFQPASRVNYAVQALIDVGELYPAIELLEESLKAVPERDDQRRILVGFLSEAQRADQIGEHLKKLIQKRKFDLRLLLVTTETSSRRLSDHTTSRLLERNPDDRRIRLTDAFLHFYFRNAEGAAEVLEDILAHHPDFAPAHAMYGQALTSTARWDEIPQWIEGAPAESSNFTDYWLTLGDVATENGQSVEAARAYWEATRRDPNRHKAWDRLGHAMHRLRASDSEYRDRISDAELEVVTDRANELFLLRERFNDFTGAGSKSQASATDLAGILLDLGRVWEAEAWSAVATTLRDEPSRELADLRGRIVEQLRRDSGWFAQDTPALAMDLSFLPQPRLDSKWDGPKRPAVIPTIASQEHLRMSEQSDRWGLQSIGEGNNPTDARLAAVIRSTGVGGGAIDYDLDGLPDLLMMNSGGTMLQTDSKPNDLMRNIGDTFIRVSDSAGVGDKGFGQGVAVGDFNEDGFADLFFANLGKNRLLRNNGDGTFTDCTDQLQGDAADTWSTSGSFVDIDGDGITDLVVTCYCETVPNLDQPCPNEQGVLGPCHPLKFAGESDLFFRGTTEGKLVNFTADWVGTLTSPGRGLGIVSGALDGQNLSIFIANDMSRNGYYSHSGGEGGKLIDSASARGVAVDGSSFSQASMGIASSDFDRDGDLDFYVTGFAREYNIYYEQISPGMWKDESSKLNLVQPTLSMVGFGTAAIDLDNDGVDEIIVTNGHIGDFADSETPPYELPLQIFRRGPAGNFVLLDDDPWGNYFRTPHVGRALWTTDVNRDGQNDVMITHMHEQIRLLVNESEDQNDRIAFKLVATDCSRDAVGAVIRFQSGGQPRALWMLSGDGYFCSAEKTLIAGLGRSDEVTDVTVTWRDGSIDEIGTLEANREYLIVQGQDEAFPLHQYER